MPYELQVALRYLVARRRQAFVSLISSSRRSASPSASWRSSSPWR